MSNRFHDTPPEVLNVIFDLAGITNARGPSPRTALASVCKSWRDVIYSNPLYWTTLHCSVKSESESTDERLVQYLKQWFGRAGSLPLTLDLVTKYPTSGHVPSQLVAFLVHDSRWEELKFNIPWKLGRTNFPFVPWLWGLFKRAGGHSLTSGVACWESLRVLRIRALGSSIAEANALGLHLAAPLLETLQIHVKESIETTWLQDPFLNWKSLRHLEFKGLFFWKDGQLTASVYLGILSQATHLKTIRVEDRGFDAPYTNPSLSTIGIRLPIAMNNLSALHFPDSQFTRHLLTQLSLPALVTLSLRGLITPSRPTLGSAITQLVQRSNCALRGLSIQYVAILDEGVSDLLLLLPTLEHLKLTCEYYQSLTTSEQSRRFLAGMAKENSQNPTFLPNLRTLSYCDHGGEFEASCGELIAAFKQIAEDPRRAWDATIEQRDPTSKEWREEQVRPHEEHATQGRCRLEKAELIIQKWTCPLYSLTANSH